VEKRLYRNSYQIDLQIYGIIRHIYAMIFSRADKFERKDYFSS